MNIQIKKAHAATRRIARVRAKVKGVASRPRLTVRRSLTHIYAQIIDDTTGRTLAAASDRDVKKTNDAKKSDLAFEVGKLIAARAKECGISLIVFDRRDKRYHGRVKALADGARDGGLNF